MLLTLAFGTHPRIAGGAAQVDHLVDVAGALVSMSGQLLRVLVIGLVYITRGGQDRRVWANALVDGGMFGHCRTRCTSRTCFSSWGWRSSTTGLRCI